MPSLPAESHSFQLQTHNLHYLTWGQSGRPALVLVHGGLDNAWTWEDLAVLLANDWHVYALDLRGHGDSDWSSTGDYLAASYLADIAKFLKDVAGWPATVVGHSMGARLSLQLIGVLPEAICRLVAIEGFGAELLPPAENGLDHKMRDWLSKRANRAEKSDIEQLGDWLRGRIITQRQRTIHESLEGPVARQIADRKKRLTADQARAFAKSNMRRVDGGWVWKFDPLARWQASHELVQSQETFWTAINAPVLHIYGDKSFAYPPAQDALDTFRNGRISVIPEAGHWVHVNQPEAVARLIREFVHD